MIFHAIYEMIMKVSMSIPPEKKRDYLRHEKKKSPNIMKRAS